MWARIFEPPYDTDDVEVSTLLLGAGADPNERLDGGMTPLHAACSLALEATAMTILRSPDTNVNMPDDTVRVLTPLFFFIYFYPHKRSRI